MSSDIADWLMAIGTIGSLVASIAAFAMSSSRAGKNDVLSNISAVQVQVRALELDVAKNYMTREQTVTEIMTLGRRLERSIVEMTRQIELVRGDINEFIRRNPEHST